MHGHRKASAYWSSLLGGNVGVEVLQWIWGMLPASWALDPIPEGIAYQLLAIGAGVVMYFTEEETVQGELTLVPAYPPAARRHGGADQPESKENANV